jgi:beta-lactamase regulating signal transducer with metallopeptidase domain/protocatechuate 3,4-dioxygenase beta subunit
MAWPIDPGTWLAHSALAGCVVLAAGSAAVRLCREPVRRLRLAELTLLGCLLAPGVYFVPGLPHVSLAWRQAPAAPAVPAAEAPAAPGWAPPEAAPAGPVPNVAAAFPPATPPETPTKPTPAGPTPPASAVLTDLAPRLIVGGYAALACCLLAWRLVGAARLRRLSRTAYPAPEAAAVVLARIAGPAGWRVRLVASDQIELPLTFGWLRPVILLPGALCRSADAPALRYCLAHEWSHVERRDILSWHLAGVVQLLFFYHPLLWWLRRQLRLCQDYLADARAAEQAAAPEDYAEYLVGLARRRLGAPVPLALGVGDRRSNLYRRVLMLLNTDQPLQRRCRRLWTASAALGVAALLLAAAAVRLDPAAADEAKAPPKKEAAPKAAAGKPITYTGKVTDKVTGKPVAGAVVTVRRTTYGDPKGEKTLEESKHTTNAEGKYSFVIPPEQAAEHFLYIELDVEAPGYAPRSHFGYSFAMIRKNEKMGGRPFFESVELRAAKEITGVVQTPEGKPAAGVKVLGYSNAEKQDGFEYGSFANARTDAAGRFRLWLVTPGPAVFWLLPEKYAPSTHVIKDYTRRGDMGRFTLEDGLVLRGKVLDVKGKPLAGVFVSANRTGGIEDFNQPVANAIHRTALTNARGEFTMAPLPPGKYDVMPTENKFDGSRRETRPVPGVFVRQAVTLKAGEAPEPLEVRAAPHVVIEAQFFDSKGKKTRGHAPDLFGRMDGNSFWHGSAKVDAAGKMTLLAPHGLTGVNLTLMTNEHGVLRYRMKKGEALRAGRRIDLGTLDEDVKGIEIVRYTAPILLLDAKDKSGKQIAGFRAQVTYLPGVKPKTRGRFINGVKGDVYLEKQEDGRWRTSQMLPDEEVTVTVSAAGYKSATQKLKLAEGATQDLAVVLEKE